MLNEEQKDQPTSDSGNSTKSVLPEVPLSDSELVEKCRTWISELCRSGGRAWTLRVPVDMSRDPDILFSELIRRFEAMRKRVG